MDKNLNISNTATQCFHCGDKILNKRIDKDDKVFCCQGCLSVYDILSANNLCEYYDLNQAPGINLKNEIRKDKYAFLDNEEIQNKLIQFKGEDLIHVTFYIPQMHCSSCLWLLENLRKFNEGIVTSQVNFTLKEIFVVFNYHETNLRAVVETLAKIGYEPHLSLKDSEESNLKKLDKSRWYKIGVAGFCFGNIMMMSLADYFQKADSIDNTLHHFFVGVSLFLSLPVLFYSATEFFTSAWAGIKNKYLNLDFPVALALVITFLRSLFEIFQGNGLGYLDSMSGIVFFMLIGRWMQSRTNLSLSFDRDYKSFFPISVNILKEGKIKPIEVKELKKDDIIQIHSQEIIPVDSVLITGNAKIDYSFVNGESMPVCINKGEIIYAGGKQLSGLIELQVAKEISHGYLTHLWNKETFNKNEKPQKNIYDWVGEYFTYIVLILGFAAGVYWFLKGENYLMWNAITTVLIVACPCALLLSQNYTFGYVLKHFSENKFYLKSSEVIQKLSKINHIVFDKTGTLTNSYKPQIRYSGEVLNFELKEILSVLVQQSSHPLSKMVLEFIGIYSQNKIENFKEFEGKGIEAWINEKHVKFGSANFIGEKNDDNIKQTKAYFSIDGKTIGVFTFSNQYRFGISKMLKQLKNKFKLSVISGDNDSELKNIEEFIGLDNEIKFNQSPAQKLDYINHIQKNFESKVMMVGDGLNDSGALKQSDVGVAISDEMNNFTPSSDAILHASKINLLGGFLKYAKKSKDIIFITFIISAIYNVIGLYFALQGILSPMIAAILMPSSSLTIIFITFVSTKYYSNKFLNKSSNINSN